MTAVLYANQALTIAAVALVRRIEFVGVGRLVLELRSVLAELRSVLLKRRDTLTERRNALIERLAALPERLSTLGGLLLGAWLLEALLLGALLLGAWLLETLLLGGLLLGAWLLGALLAKILLGILGVILGGEILTLGTFVRPFGVLSHCDSFFR